MKDLKNLRLADLELLITAAQLRSLGKAAEFHHLSQSAASTAVQRVEAAIGVLLSSHEKRQFRLTQEGQRLLPRLEEWVKQLKDLVLGSELPPIRLVTTHALAQIAVPALLSIDLIDFKHLRPDRAYSAILRGEADIAIVLDNSPWKNVEALEIAKGQFRLYAQSSAPEVQPVLLPEDQIEVVSFQQRWQQAFTFPLPIKSRIPSWSLIAHICARSSEVGFLPDFLAAKFDLQPVKWQPAASSYRVLAIYKQAQKQPRFDRLIQQLQTSFIA